MAMAMTMAIHLKKKSRSIRRKIKQSTTIVYHDVEKAERVHLAVLQDDPFKLSLPISMPKKHHLPVQCCSQTLQSSKLKMHLGSQAGIAEITDEAITAEVMLVDEDAHARSSTISILVDVLALHTMRKRSVGQSSMTSSVIGGEEELDEWDAKMKEEGWDVDDDSKPPPDYICEKYGLYKPDWAWGDGTMIRGRGRGRGRGNEGRGSLRGGRGGRIGGPKAKGSRGRGGHSWTGEQEFASEW
ncbi:hypothetical protein BDV96DRAFT_651750 [Lophiotrema nucula]|uniref:Uncharacterized protein n=1 Tax=Lophiotrema nucula TaxID=690887 RepID=A0A6A5YSR8_9PLEO|nr:hypothetical protein BDV96DRAFT_651750 [Lophiotrema nucula]